MNTRTIVYSLLGAIGGFLATFLISNLIGGGSLEFVFVNMIVFGLIGAVLASFISNKKIDMISIIVLLAAIGLEIFYLNAQIESNKIKAERFKQMEERIDQVKKEMLNNRRFNQVNEEVINDEIFHQTQEELMNFTN